MWRITQCHEKIRDAESERLTSIYSPTFFSPAVGYKMCARSYLYGDGNARRTHMSLFFVLLSESPIVKESIQNFVYFNFKNKQKQTKQVYRS
jgi:hypothetical protein